MPIFYIKDGTGNFVPVPALQGKQGEKGDPGVYVGTEQPDDAQVWVKPDGEADPILLYEEQELTDEQKTQARANIGATEEGVLPPATADTLGGVMIGDGLVADEDGRVGVKRKNELEHVETFVFGYSALWEKPEDWETNWTAYYKYDESYGIIAIPDATAPMFVAGSYWEYTGDNLDIWQFRRTKWPDGESYNFSSAYVFVNPRPLGTGYNLYCQFMSVPVVLAASTANVQAIGSDYQYQVSALFKLIGNDAGVYELITCGTGYGGGGLNLHVATGNNPSVHTMPVSTGNITYIEVFTFSERVPVPAGSIIRIYGVRA